MSFSFFLFLGAGYGFGSWLLVVGEENTTQKHGGPYGVSPRTVALTRSVEMLGRARRGWSVAVAAVHGGVDGTLAGGPVHHPVPQVLVPLEKVPERVSARHALRLSPCVHDDQIPQKLPRNYHVHLTLQGHGLGMLCK